VVKQNADTLWGAEARRNQKGIMVDRHHRAQKDSKWPLALGGERKRRRLRVNRASAGGTEDPEKAEELLWQPGHWIGSSGTLRDCEAGTVEGKT